MPGEYHAIAETKLIAGQHVDMMYSEEDRLVRWNTAGWTRDIEGLPGVDEIKAKMYAINVKNMSLPDGKLGGLPYYTGFNSFVCNQKHLDAAKIEPPATWDEMLDQCRKLKKDKVSEYPYISGLGAAVGEPVLEPVLDLVLGRCQGLRRQLRPRRRPALPRRARACTARSTRSSSSRRT